MEKYHVPIYEYFNNQIPLCDMYSICTVLLSVAVHGAEPTHFVFC